MLSRPALPNPFVGRFSSEWQRSTARLITCSLLSAAILAGCSSFSPAPRESHEIHTPPATASAPPHATGKWSSQSREGREALLESDFQRAEMLFFSALEASNSFRSLDVRVDVSFRNLARLASVYRRIGRVDAANRVIAAVESFADRRRIAVRRIDDYRMHYEILSAASLDTRLQPVAQKVRRDSAPYDRLIRHAADSFDVDPALVKAVVAAESNFEPRAVSEVGAQGLMQLMPATARAMGVQRPFAPSENIRGGVRYLRSLLDRFEQVDLALAAYNAGPEAVMRHGGIPPFPETEAYVTKVLSNYRRYQVSFSR